MWLAFFVTVLVYLLIGGGVALLMRRLLRDLATLDDCLIYAIAWPVVVILAAVYYFDEGD